MAKEPQAPPWIDLGSVEELRDRPLREIKAGSLRIALSYRDGQFGAISGICNHVGGPLGDGTLDGEYVVCPWHHYKFHRSSGDGEPGYEADRVPQYALKIENGRVLRQPEAVKASKPPATSAAPIGAQAEARTGWRFASQASRPRSWTSTTRATRLPKCCSSMRWHTPKRRELRDAADPAQRPQVPPLRGVLLQERTACTWPCSITEMDQSDQMDQVYEAVVHWADVVLLATPIRWGAPSSLYYKMAERMNCIQNQITMRNEVLIRNKVVAFIITGRSGQHPGRGRADAHVLQRARVRVSAVPVHRALARLGRPRTWSATSSTCARAARCAKARASWSRGPCIWRAISSSSTCRANISSGAGVRRIIPRIITASIRTPNKNQGGECRETHAHGNHERQARVDSHGC